MYFFFYQKVTKVCILLVSMLIVIGCQEHSSKNNQKEAPESAVNLTGVDLRQAALKGRLEIVKEAVNQNVSADGSDRQGRTSLMLASFNGHTAIVKFLIEEGAAVKKENKLGRNALMLSSSGPFPETVRLLLENRADPNAVDKSEGWTALMFAAAEGNPRVVQVLLEYSADACIKDQDEETALDFASNNNHKEVVEILKQVTSSC